MPLVTGTRFGPYEIIASIGAGGMGEVYRARDTRLGRDVALKISAEQFSERFEREARAVASLNHPNICTLHDVGPNYLVMELVEGESPQGPLLLETALAYARQIANALDAAHQKGIVHRDLKPGNIKIKADGTVKVLDFGLAKMLDAREGGGAEAAVAGITASPTMTSPAITRAGVILGTAAYMSPEQARGKTVDKRADIWAFGVVLYEMITGQRLFKGDDVSETLAAVIKEEPRWNEVPTQVRRLLQSCLEKDPNRRLRDIGDVWRLLDEAPASPIGEPRHPRLLGWSGLAVAAVVAAALTPIAVTHFREAPLASPEPVRFQIAPPEKLTLSPNGGFAVSPDGRKLVYAAAGPDNVMRLWLRALDSIEAKPLAGTEGSTGLQPFWSPDSRFVAFNAEGKLKKLDISGGPPQTVCDVPVVAGGSWNRDGLIVFGANLGVVMRVSAAGGVAVPLTQLDPARQEVTHVFPSFLPDGRHFLYLRYSNIPDKSGTYIGDVDTTPEAQSASPLVATPFESAYLSAVGTTPGQLLFRRQGTLMAQPFDEQSLKLSGDPVPVAEGLASFLGVGFFSGSTNGTLVYLTGSPAQSSQLTWFDRQGKALGSVAEPGVYTAATLALSPDAARAAVSRLDYGAQARRDIWLLDLGPGRGTRFSFGTGFSGNAVWSPDGSRIIFGSNPNGPYDLYLKQANGANDEEVLLKSSESKTPSSWSSDGRWLLYTAADPKTNSDLWVLPLDGDRSSAGSGRPENVESRKPRLFLGTEFNEGQGQFSPDSRWVAYQSDESGRMEVYVRAFSLSSPSGKWLVSKGGATGARWRRDGKELFYTSADGSITAVDVRGSEAFRVGTPESLFKLPASITTWDVNADGTRFLVPVPMQQRSQSPFTVVLNWQAGLKH
jgi:serine/threonine protein kinase/Tol biopolymer transport system component